MTVDREAFLRITGVVMRSQGGRKADHFRFRSRAFPCPAVPGLCPRMRAQIWPGQNTAIGTRMLGKTHAEKSYYVFTVLII